MEFRTELRQLLNLIVHSLYTRREIFLRELISNAADAIDRIRFMALTSPELLENDADWKIRIIPDSSTGTLTVSDNGVGMSEQTIVDELGTIAGSGTRAFLENLRKTDAKNLPELIGQFGVGFYSSFMVADRVTVVSRPAGAGARGVRWESDGQGEFTIEPCDKPSRGTDVILHLREDAREFLQFDRLREIVRRYSDFIEHPIVLEKGGGAAPETLNSRKAIWLRPRTEVKDEEYADFYRQLTRDDESPLKTIHIAAEGTTEFKALLYIPRKRPADFLWHQPRSAIALYVRRVMIMPACDQLLPSWLRFVRGVVESSDLPLNVSREMLQHNPILQRIRNNLVNRVLRTLEEMLSGEYELYVGFWREFGEVLKEGIPQDFEYRQRLADLLLVQSTATAPDAYTTLARYVESMKPDQKEILYLTGDSRAALAASPCIEAARAAGHEVLLLTDPIDEFVVAHLDTYRDKPFRAADRAGSADAADAGQMRGLLDFMKKKIPEVHDVRLSARLKQSAACLVTDEAGPSAHFERLMNRIGRGREIPRSRRILEINPDHPAINAAFRLFQKNPDDPFLEDLARVFYEQAVIAEGSLVADPAALVRRINDLIMRAAAQSDKMV